MARLIKSTGYQKKGTALYGGAGVVGNLSAGADLLPSYTASGGFQFDIYHNVDNVNIDNHPTNSANILSKSFAITIFYEE